MGTLGARLKQEREKQGITLEQVSQTTKITVRMLQALEDERFDRLPGGIFNKGFVRAYARHLKLDEEQAVADYMAATGPVVAVTQKEPELAAIATQKSRTRRPPPVHAERIPWGPVALALLLIAFAFAVWGSYSRQTGGFHIAGAHLHHRAPAGTMQTSPNAPPPSGNQVSTGSPLQPAGTFLVLIKAHDDCWLDITSDGKDVMHDTLEAGQEKSISGRNEVVLKAGNVGGLDLWFNGARLPAAGEPEEVKTLVFDSHGLRPEEAKVQPVQSPAPQP